MSENIELSSQKKASKYLLIPIELTTSDVARILGLPICQVCYSMRADLVTRLAAVSGRDPVSLDEVQGAGDGVTGE